MAEIQSFFGDRVISKGLWPPRSPDLTPPDYFLWGYLKGRVYQNKSRTIDALKANITEEIQAATADLLARTFQNVARQIQSCLGANGGHLQHMLWCLHISQTTNVLLFKFRCDIFIGVGIIKEMPGSVASGTLCISGLLACTSKVVVNRVRMHSICVGKLHEHPRLCHVPWPMGLCWHLPYTLPLKLTASTSYSFQP